MGSVLVVRCFGCFPFWILLIFVGLTQRNELSSSSMKFGASPCRQIVSLVDDPLVGWPDTHVNSWKHEWGTLDPQ